MALDASVDDSLNHGMNVAAIFSLPEIEEVKYCICRLVNLHVCQYVSI